MNNDQNAWEHIQAVTQPALMLAPGNYLAEMRVNLVADGIPDAVDAVARQHTPLIFDWLVGFSQFQGNSDANAAAYITSYGMVRWDDVKRALDGLPECYRLRSYWNFEGLSKLLNCSQNR